jgi:hypothetical protein
MWRSLSGKKQAFDTFEVHHPEWLHRRVPIVKGEPPARPDRREEVPDRTPQISVDSLGPTESAGSGWAIRSQGPTVESAVSCEHDHRLDVQQDHLSVIRKMNLMWERGPSETVLTGERPVRPARRRFPDRYGMRDISLWAAWSTWIGGTASDRTDR